jgi:hypothetical protein
MSNIGLTLGGIKFRDFEVPEQIVFGGGQAITVHQIIGGNRIVDALGAADGEILLAGVFSGPDAAIRAQALDAARSIGGALPLIWQGFFYSVIIAELTAAYTKPWWIPFRLRLSVVRNLVAAVPNLLTQASNDLTMATQTYAPQAGLSIAGISVTSLSSVSSGLFEANAMLSAEGESFSGAAILLNGTSETGTGVAAIESIASSAGILAGLASARAFLGRVVTTLNGV